MHDAILKFYIKTRNLMEREDGQDLVEYALVVSLIALAATVAMGAMGTKISDLFDKIGTHLT